jgi:hypothetical protein
LGGGSDFSGGGFGIELKAYDFARAIVRHPATTDPVIEVNLMSDQGGSVFRVKFSCLDGYIPRVAISIKIRFVHGMKSYPFGCRLVYAHYAIGPGVMGAGYVPLCEIVGGWHCRISSPQL